MTLKGKKKQLCQKVIEPVFTIVNIFFSSAFYHGMINSNFYYFSLLLYVCDKINRLNIPQTLEINMIVIILRKFYASK